MNLTDKNAQDSIISVPKIFELSANPSEGEKAEKAVFEAFKSLQIPGYKMVIFSCLRFTGLKDEKSEKQKDENSEKQIIRESDLR